VPAEHAAYNIRANTRETEPFCALQDAYPPGLLEGYASILTCWYITYLPFTKSWDDAPIVKHPTMGNAVSRQRWPRYTFDGTGMGARPDFPQPSVFPSSPHHLIGVLFRSCLSHSHTCLSSCCRPKCRCRCNTRRYNSYWWLEAGEEEKEWEDRAAVAFVAWSCGVCVG
jgi:hypothetical protein